MQTAVEMQQFSETGPRLPAAPMPAAGAPAGQEPGPLQECFDKGVGQRDGVLPSGHLIEVAPIEAGVPLAVQPQDALDLGDRGPLGRGLCAPAVVQPVIAVLLEAPPHAANAARTPAEDIGHLQPCQRAAQAADNDLLDSHGSLHSLARDGHRHLLGSDIPAHLRANERSSHVSSKAAI